jgi:AcrR family transcriptional regulator
MAPIAKASRTTRREQALETRRRMLRAAYELFCEHGYAATTLQAIAQRAGVAVQTIYFTFHTKSAILSETVGACIFGFDRWSPIADPVRAGDAAALGKYHAWWTPFEEARDAAAALEVFVDATVEIMRRVGPLVAVVTEAAAGDQEMRAVSDIGEERRVESYRAVVRVLAKKGGLRRGLGIERANDILLTLLSGEVYQLLCARRGWTPMAARRWFLETLRQQLLA